MTARRGKSYARLIAFRTAAGHGQVPAMANYIAETLRAGGVPAEDIQILPHEETAAMLVRVPGRDAAARPILFSGHMDVVDARPEDWERNPFELIEEGGFFFGRGTGDNKAGIASMVSTILRMRADGHRPAAHPGLRLHRRRGNRHGDDAAWSPRMTGSAMPNLRSTPTPAAGRSARTAGR